MIRRPPRSTLFPYTTALPISECFGWASVQLDGGIEKVTRRVEDWFAAELEAADELRHETVGLEHLRLGLMAADRKSTRLNSSHANISYAVFCLKKNKIVIISS